MMPILAGAQSGALGTLPEDVSLQLKLLDKHFGFKTCYNSWLKPKGKKHDKRWLSPKNLISRIAAVNETRTAEHKKKIHAKGYTFTGSRIQKSKKLIRQRKVLRQFMKKPYQKSKFAIEKKDWPSFELQPKDERLGFMDYRTFKTAMQDKKRSTNFCNVGRSARIDGLLKRGQGDFLDALNTTKNQKKLPSFFYQGCLHESKAIAEQAFAAEWENVGPGSFKIHKEWRNVRPGARILVPPRCTKPTIDPSAFIGPGAYHPKYGFLSTRTRFPNTLLSHIGFSPTYAHKAITFKDETKVIVKPEIKTKESIISHREAVAKRKKLKDYKADELKQWNFYQKYVLGNPDEEKAYAPELEKFRAMNWLTLIFGILFCAQVDDVLKERRMRLTSRWQRIRKEIKPDESPKFVSNLKNQFYSSTDLRFRSVGFLLRMNWRIVTKLLYANRIAGFLSDEGFVIRKLRLTINTYKRRVSTVMKTIVDFWIRLKYRIRVLYMQYLKYEKLYPLEFVDCFQLFESGVNLDMFERIFHCRTMTDEHSIHWVIKNQNPSRIEEDVLQLIAEGGHHVDKFTLTKMRVIRKYLKAKYNLRSHRKRPDVEIKDSTTEQTGYAQNFRLSSKTNFSWLLSPKDFRQLAVHVFYLIAKDTEPLMIKNNPEATFMKGEASRS